MSTDIARVDDQDSLAITRPDTGQAKAALAHYAATGDVSRMSDEQRGAFILFFCKQLGLTPSSGPIEIIEFYDPEQKRKVAKVYVKAEATKQLGNLHRIRVVTVSEGMAGDGLFKVAVRGHQPDGRTYDEVGYVSLTDREGNRLGNNAYKNALMKCHTVAKRRLISGMIGFSAPPEGGRRLYLGPNAEILEHPTEEDRYVNDNPDLARISTGQSRFETMAPTVETGLEGTSDQLPRPEVIDPPKPEPGPRPSFRPSEEDVKRLLGAWHAIVKGYYLEDENERHKFCRQWTTDLGWPKEKQTDSSRVMFARMTQAESADVLAHVRALMAAEREQLLAHAREADEDTLGA